MFLLVINMEQEAEHIVRKFLASCGTQKNASKIVGVNFRTFSYWLNYAKNVPSKKLTAMRLYLMKEALVSSAPTAIVSDSLHAPVALTSLTISQRVQYALQYESSLTNRALATNRVNNKQNESKITFLASSRLKNLDALDEKEIFLDQKDINASEKYQRRTDVKVAAFAGFNSKDTYRFAKQVVLHGSPQLIKSMDDERLSISQAAAVAKLPIPLQLELIKKNKKEITAYFKQSRIIAKPSITRQKIQFLNLTLYEDTALLKAEAYSQLPVRIVFSGLLRLSDEAGKFAWDPAQLQSVILPFIPINVANVLAKLIDLGLLQQRKRAGQTYGYIKLKKQYISEGYSHGKNKNR